MIDLATFRELFEFNYWARDQQLQSCAALTLEQFVQPMRNSYTSVRDTLAHLVFAEWVWLERWRGRSPNRQDVAAFMTGKFPTLEAVRDAWRPVEAGMRDFLQSCPEESLSQPLNYTNTKGEAWSYPLWRTIFHVVNHQTYHRGQITTLLRQLGTTPPTIDYLVAHDLHLLK